MSNATETDLKAIEKEIQGDSAAGAGNEVVAAIKDLKDKLTEKAAPAAPAGPTREELRKQIKEQTGFTDAQLDFHEKSLETVARTSTSSANEKLAWLEIKDEVGGIDADTKTEMDAELKAYPAHMRGDKVLLEKVYYMALGKQTWKNGGIRRGVSDEFGEKSDPNVITRRIVSQNPGSATSLGGGQKATPKVSDDEMKQVNLYFKGDVKEYLKYKNNQDVGFFKAAVK